MVETIARISRRCRFAENAANRHTRDSSPNQSLQRAACTCEKSREATTATAEEFFRFKR